MPELETHKKTEIEDANSLKGTLLSVAILGVVLVGTWIGVFNLFVSR